MEKDNKDFLDMSVFNLKLDLGRFFQAEKKKEASLDVETNATKVQNESRNIGISLLRVTVYKHAVGLNQSDASS